MASELDDASDRIVQFLAENYGVPINAVFFRHFADGDKEYLARTWLLDPQVAESRPARRARSKRRQWNGRDYYAVLGGREDYEGGRWSLAQRYGFLNGGSGKRYWEPGLFANQNTACKLTDQNTIDRVSAEFGLDTAS